MGTPEVQAGWFWLDKDHLCCCLAQKPHPVLSPTDRKEGPDIAFLWPPVKDYMNLLF